MRVQQLSTTTLLKLLESILAKVYHSDLRIQDYRLQFRPESRGNSHWRFHDLKSWSHVQQMFSILDILSPMSLDTDDYESIKVEETVQSKEIPAWFKESSSGCISSCGGSMHGFHTWGRRQAQMIGKAWIHVFMVSCPVVGWVNSRLSVRRLRVAMLCCQHVGDNITASGLALVWHLAC